MAANARMSKLSGSKAEQYIFNWRVFTGWDYTIGNQETASNTVMAIVIKLRESIADCRVSLGSNFRCLQFTLRVIANLVICGMLAFSIYCISFAVQKSQTAVEQEGNLFTKNQVPSVVATITHVFPMIFDLIGRLENYHPRTALRAHLTRCINIEKQKFSCGYLTSITVWSTVLVLYVLNYLTLIVALFDKMDAIRKKEPVESVEIREKRQLGGRNPHIPRPPPYASRTFENRTDMLRFIAKSTQRFEQTRTTRDVATTAFTVAPQFGPVNVNNPNAILRNGTLKKPFEAKRIGPNPLPIYTPPPRTFPALEPVRMKEKFGGPDFPPAPSHTKVTKPPIRITRPPAARKTTSTATPTTNKVKSDSIKADPSNSESSDDDPPDNRDFVGEIVEVNETMRLPAAAERKSSVDEVYNTDICWETIIGQEIVKLVTMDLIVTIVSIIVIDFLRGLWIKYCSAWWCWDIETTFPEYGEFKVAENIKQFLPTYSPPMAATMHIASWFRNRIHEAERTEEKKKIFELAGGGKKKVDQDRDRDHRKITQYLPIIEQQRREPWRAFNDEEQLHAEDSSESEEEDQEEAPSPTYVQRMTAPVPSSTAETVAAMHFHPSLG
ncbi:unnamed protein product [Strongylus vulgaris]|uniref:TMC domain-containing protein n=1 Tax=Strongylus vulgaris TaxID=40348 RepID=A0A3P7JBY4_STRVU|nr:unnamed protein product [Strongylus vulgaris]